MKRLITALVFIVTFLSGFSVQAEDTSLGHKFTQESCVDNVTKMLGLALELGEVYEKSGNPNIQPSQAGELDQFYHLNFLDSVEMYGKGFENPDLHPRVVERNTRINKAIFEGINQGRTTGLGEEADLVNLMSLESGLKLDCIE